MGSRHPWLRDYSFSVGDSAKLSIQRDGQTISYQVPVAGKQDLQGRLADFAAKEQSKIPQLGILALTLDDSLRSMLPPLRKRAGAIVTGGQSEGVYLGERLFSGDVVYAVNGMPADGVDSLRSVLRRRPELRRNCSASRTTRNVLVRELAGPVLDLK